MTLTHNVTDINSRLYFGEITISGEIVSQKKETKQMEWKFLGRGLLSDVFTEQ